jgi:Xaa-Pro aminopeptidase
MRFLESERVVMSMAVNNPILPVAWQEERLQRRQAILAKMEPHSLFLWPGSSLTYRNMDVAHPFRPESSFYYLSGCDEPGAAMLLDQKSGDFLFFCEERSERQKIWDGPSLGPKEAPSVLGAEAAFSIEDLDAYLSDCLSRPISRIYCPLKLYPFWEERLLSLMKKCRRSIPIEDLSAAVHALRLIKSPLEQECMRKAASISVAAHQDWMSFVKRCGGGAYEYQVEALLLQRFYSQGARHCAYSSIVAGGANACILHYQANNQRLKEGDVCLVDAGCEWDYYASDITRVMPVGGRFSTAQKVIYELVLESQEAGLSVLKAGVPFDRIQEEILGVLLPGLKSLKMMDNYKNYYMHRSGHWLGLDVHDVGGYQKKEKPILLEPGMALTIEPGLYFSPSDPTVPIAYRGIGVRIEDDFLITETGYENLSAGLAKTVAELEAL